MTSFNLLNKIEDSILSRGHCPVDFLLLIRDELYFLRNTHIYPNPLDFYKAFSAEFSSLPQIQRLASLEPRDALTEEALSSVRIQTSLPSWRLIFLEGQQPAFLWLAH